MMAITHACIAAAGVSLLFSTAEPLTLALAVLGSQLPDLDTTTSFIGQICFPLSSWIEDRFPHRSVTHSLLATMGLAAIALPIGYVLGGIGTAAALPVGHLLACFSDTFTKQGVQLFWPEPAWAISVSNPKRRLRTGGPAEYWVLAAAVALLCLGIYVAGGGGVTRTVGQSLGLKDSAIATYNQSAATNHVYAEVTGVWARDRTRADGRYLILGTSGSEFILFDSRGVYKTGEQLLPSKLTTSTGEPASITLTTLSFNDEDPLPKLQRLQGKEGLAFVSGELTIDFPEEVELPVQPHQFQQASLNGSTLRFEFCAVDQALALLKDQYAIGAVTVRLMQPLPSQIGTVK